MEGRTITEAELDSANRVIEELNKRVLRLAAANLRGVVAYSPALMLELHEAMSDVSRAIERVVAITERIAGVQPAEGTGTP